MGGFLFVMLQALGWAFFSMSLIIFMLLDIGTPLLAAAGVTVRPSLFSAGVGGVIAEVCTASSLLVYVRRQIFIYLFIIFKVQLNNNKKCGTYRFAAPKPAKVDTVKRVQKFVTPIRSAAGSPILTVLWVLFCYNLEKVVSLLHKKCIKTKPP
jgi:type IV secretory pathway TrbF-like protein